MLGSIVCLFIRHYWLIFVKFLINFHIIVIIVIIIFFLIVKLITNKSVAFFQLLCFDAPRVMQSFPAYKSRESQVSLLTGRKGKWKWTEQEESCKMCKQILHRFYYYNCYYISSHLLINALCMYVHVSI